MHSDGDKDDDDHDNDHDDDKDDDKDDDDDDDSVNKSIIISSWYLVFHPINRRWEGVGWALHVSASILQSPSLHKDWWSSSVHYLSYRTWYEMLLYLYINVKIGGGYRQMWYGWIDRLIGWLIDEWIDD